LNRQKQQVIKVVSRPIYGQLKMLGISQQLSSENAKPVQCIV